MASKSSRAGRRKKWKGGKTSKAGVARRKARIAQGRVGNIPEKVPQFQGK